MTNRSPARTFALLVHFSSGRLPLNPLRTGPKQIQVHRVAAAVPQIPSYVAAETPTDRGESRFPRGCEERDSDLHVPCTLLDSGRLPPNPLRSGFQTNPSSSRRPLRSADSLSRDRR
jgi:hypothetical protein